MALLRATSVACSGSVARPVSTIRYQLPELADVRITIYNLLGQRVALLVDTQQAAGFYTLQWSGRNALGRQVASGLYIYRMEANDGAFVQTQKMILLK